MPALVSLEQEARARIVGFGVLVGGGAFPVLDDSFGGPNIAEGEEGFDHDRGEGGGEG